MTAYLDYNASTPMRPEAVSAMTDAIAVSANPSSVHGPGRAARGLIEQARMDIARNLMARAEDLVFTSGATEANNLAIHGAKALGIDRIIVSAIEHDAVRAPAESSGLPVEVWPVLPDGRADLNWLEDRLKDPALGKVLVCLMAANNETGVIQPVTEAGNLVRETGGLFHVDAVQMAGHARFDFAGSLAHFASVSAHKAGGPTGVGALIVSCDAQLTPLLSGGGQEKNRRGGTENVPGIAGFAAALNAIANSPTEIGHVETLRNAAEYAIKSANSSVSIWGQDSPRLHNTICMSAEGWPSEIQVIALDLAGYAVSAGAACSSGKVKKSRVLQAMGADDANASSALRISLGWASIQADVDGFVEAWSNEYNRVVARA